MLSSFISGLTSKAWLGVIGVLFGVIIALGVNNYFTSSSLDLTKKDLTKKEIELKETKEDHEKEMAKKDEEFLKAKETYEKNLAIQIEITKQQQITKSEKQEVIKFSNKVKEELQKRGEIKQDEKKDDFITVEF